MKALFGAAFLAPLMLAGPGRAEFQIAPSASGSPEPIVLSPPGPLPAPGIPRRRVPALPAVSLAVGFGKQVPLAFAARQIVPVRVKFAFGSTVDQDALVDWTGGRPWIEALRAAVRPLGLHVLVNRTTVTITRT